MALRPSTRSLVTWGAQYGIPKNDVITLRALVNRYVRFQVNAHNGDVHSAAKNRQNKDECSRLWEQDAEQTARRLVSFAGKCGFESVDFGSGIRPVFRKGIDSMIIVPE